MNRTDIDPGAVEPRDGQAIAHPVAPGRSSDTRRSSLWAKLALQRFSGLYVIALMLIIFSILEPAIFPTSTNLRIILAGDAISAVLALGLTIAVAAGAFDLSVAGTMTLSIIVVGWLQAVHGVHPVVAVVAVLLMGAAVGVINAIIVVGFRVSSMIATLGMMSILTAIGYRVIDGRPVVTGMAEGFLEFGRGAPFGIPLTVIYMLIVAAVIWYVLDFTPVGRRVRAVGGNEQAARLAGIRAPRYVAGAFIASGVVAAFAGVMFAARLGNSPIDGGGPNLLPAFAAVFLGATQITPGRVNVLGTLVAIYMLAIGVNGLQLHFPDNPWLRGFFQGFMLILALILAARSSKEE